MDGVYQCMCQPSRKKNFDDVTVSAWIPAQLCSKLDLFAMRLRMTRREALEVVLCSVLAERHFLLDLEKLLREGDGASAFCD